DWLLRTRLDQRAVDRIRRSHFSAGRIDLQHDGFDTTVIASLLQRRAHIIDHRIAHVARERRTDQAAHGDDSDLVEASARPSLEQDFAKTRDRFRFSDTGQALKRCNHQHEVHEQTGTKRDKQKDTETTELAISRHDRTKLAENRGAHKRFSSGYHTAMTSML